ncbi:MULTISPECIES: hypothetical protein [Amycolatopsis]|uniref:Lipoprotein n=1 Tax=Amycolatopsis dongchuanensis TaxID=1070866 RepID=A0ABP9PXM9_9PSEU
MAALVAAVALLVSACGGARAGTAVPNGAEAAAYVSAKFSATLDKLADRLDGTDSRKSVLDTFARFDTKKINSTVSAVQLGDPPARLAKNHSNLDSNEYLDMYHPANSPVEYMLLGPVYASLAPTHWVSMPYTAGDLNECFWAGGQGVCKLLGAVSDSVDQGRAKTATSKADGGVELTADVTLGAVLQNRVVVFPQSILDQIGAELKAQTLRARIVIDARGKLAELQLEGTVAGGGHEVELRTHYRLDGTPTENDLPKLPDPADVTVLADSTAVSDFYARMGEIQGR